MKRFQACVQALHHIGVDPVHALRLVDGDGGDAIRGPVGNGGVAGAVASAHGGVLARAEGVGSGTHWSPLAVPCKHRNNAGQRGPTRRPARRRCAMTSERGEGFGFAPVHDAPIPYMQRIRDYYVALGYGAPYEWAHYASVPFQPLKKPLAESRVTIITTASPYQPDKGDQGPGAPYNSAAKFYKVYSGDTAKDHDLRISHVGIDRKHTTAEDSGTWFPLPELRRVAGAGPHRLARSPLSRPAHQPQPSRDARGRLPRGRRPLQGRRRRCRDPAAQLPRVPSERQPRRAGAGGGGIATVVMGCAKDIVEYVGVPRLLFSDFPLGNPAGRPKDKDVASLHARAGAAGAGDGAGRRAPPCSRRFPGARAPTGSSTSRTSPRCRPRRSRAAAPSSTGRKRSPRTFARRLGSPARARELVRQ